MSRAPDFFVAGHPKSGTTAMYEMLRRHPQIFMPDLKEPRYFASDLPSRYNNPLDPSAPAETYEDYLALFAPASPDQILGEASPVYIWSKTAAERIAQAIPSARIIAIFREPASYVRSLHFELMQARIEKETDVGKAIALEPTRKGKMPGSTQDWPEALQYTGNVRYLEQLRRFHAFFPREQVKVIIYDDFRRDNEQTMRGVLGFLGVDDSGPIEVLDANPTVGLRSVRLDELMQGVDTGRVPGARALKTVARAVAPRSARRKVYETIQRRVVFGSPKPPDEDVMLDLRRRFRPEVEAFGEYLQRDLLALWGYDEIS